MSEQDQRFRGKRIVITGGGGFLGCEGCLYFARRGARVAVLDNSPTALKETCTAVEKVVGQDHLDILPVECDVTSAASVQSAVESVKAVFGGIDMLWNNAGYQGEIKPTLEYNVQDFATVMNINVTGMFIVLQAVAKVMAQQPSGGSIVNTASVAAIRCTPAMVAYASSKAAVLAMTVSCSKFFTFSAAALADSTKSLKPSVNAGVAMATQSFTTGPATVIKEVAEDFAVDTKRCKGVGNIIFDSDLAPHNIRVNAVSPALIGPGYMWTRQNELHAQSGSPYFASDPETVAQNKIASVPMKRLGTSEEVVKSVAFLFSDDASYTTGINIVVDGGMSGGLKA